MTAWQNADTSARLRGCEKHLPVSLADDGKTDGRRTGLIVPRESNLPGAVKYQLLSQARRRAQETARRVLVDVETWGHARHFPGDARGGDSQWAVRADARGRQRPPDAGHP